MKRASVSMISSQDGTKVDYCTFLHEHLTGRLMVSGCRTISRAREQHVRSIRRR
jgi:hypothetical protein